MKIEQLKQIVKVADTGSISATADKLYLSHSTLSSSLRAAEQEFGKEIFIRKPNGGTKAEIGWIHDPSRKLTPQAKEYIAALKANF